MNHKVSTYTQNNEHTSVPHVEFEPMSQTEWLTIACLNPVYQIVGSRLYTIIPNCTMY